MYKVIYLIRHSENIRNKNIVNKELPLSEEGKIRAEIWQGGCCEAYLCDNR